MNRLKTYLMLLLCITLISSFSSCGEEKELQLLFGEGSVLVTSKESVAIIGTEKIDSLDLEHGFIDTVVIMSYTEEGLSGFKTLCNSCEIKSIYIPGYSEDSEVYNEIIDLCDQSEAFIVSVEGTMSFGVGDGSVSVMAGSNELYSDPYDNSLMARITLSEKSILICGSARQERVDEFLAVESRSYDIVNLTEHQKGIEKTIIEALTPTTLVFSGVEAYNTDCEFYEGRVKFITDGKNIGAEK